MAGLGSALSRGLSAAGYGAGDLYAKQSLAEQAAGLQAERDARLAELQVQTKGRELQMTEESADRQRQQQTARIGAETNRIADEQVGKKRGLIDAGITDRESWTPEMQAAVDQSLAQDRSNIVNDPRTRSNAAIATGDISPKDAATIERDERRLDITERTAAQKDRIAERRDETMRYIAELKEETAQRRIEALIRKGEGKDQGAREVLAFIDGARKELTSEESNLRQMMNTEMKDKAPSAQKAIKAEYEAKFAAIGQKRQQLESDFDAVRERVGLPARGSKAPDARPDPGKPASAAPKPAPAASALPLPTEKSALQVGKTYRTSRGLAKWNGSAFELAD